MADPIEAHDPQTELTTDEQPLGSAEAPESPEAPPSRDPVVERIHELTGEIGTLRSVAGAQQAELQRLRQQAGTVPFTPNPEYEQHAFKRYLDQQYGGAFGNAIAQQQQVILQQNVQLDLVNTRLNIDDQYGAGTYRKLARAVEDEFQAEWAKGTPESREKIFYRVAAQRQMNLVPVDEREDSGVQRERRRGAKLATVSNGAPARRAGGAGPEKPIAAMTKAERDAAMEAHVAKFGGF
jgi:hypothetical protein